MSIDNVDEDPTDFEGIYPGVSKHNQICETKLQLTNLDTASEQRETEKSEEGKCCHCSPSCWRKSIHCSGDSFLL